MKRRRQLASFGIVFAVIVILITAALVPLLRAYDNRLVDHPNWNVTKTEAELTLMGARSYLTGSQALAGNRLNLSAWHGYHEVMLKTEVVPEEVRFRMFVGPEAYVYFIFNRENIVSRRNERYEAVRLSKSGLLPSGYMVVDDFGRFLEKRLFPCPMGCREGWNQAALRFGENALTVTVNGAAVMTIDTSSRGKQHIGFRSGAHPASIDDVVIVQAQGRPVFRERFSNNDGILGWTLGILSAISLGGLLCYTLLWRLTRNGLAAARIMLAAGITLVLCTWIFYFFYASLYSRRYPLEDAALQEEEYAHVLARAERIRKTIEQEFTKEKPGGVERVLFLGTSQTWGVGAMRREETFVAEVERRLNRHYAGGIRFECIKAAVPGSNSELLREFYEEFWVDLSHRLMVINLSVNDRDPTLLESNLRALVRLNRERGIDTLFVLEAISPEETPYGPTPNRQIMRRLGEEFGIPVIDLFVAMKERLNDGILWWDLVHPTSFGHQCIADVLTPAVIERLDRVLGPPARP